jgi:hypothetical protein
MTGELEAFSSFEADGWRRQAGTYGDFVGRVTARVVEPLLDAAGVRGYDVPVSVKLVSARKPAR